MKPPAAGRSRLFALRAWRSPLARDVDRAEAMLTWSVLVLWMLSLPLLAVIGSVYSADLRDRVVDEQRSSVQVDAVLVKDAGFVLTTAGSAGLGVTAEATWVGRDGEAATGSIEVAPGARAGDHVTIWLDRTGQVVPMPMKASEVGVQAVLMVVFGWISFGLLLAAAWWLVRLRLDRQRWRAWAQEWETAGPGDNSR